jgi:signal peptidase I
MATTDMREASDGLESGWLESIQGLLSALVVALFIMTFVVQAFQVPSGSMEETLLIGDYIFVDKLHFGGRHDSGVLVPSRPVQRGDIVVFYYPVNPALHLVKRVIGVPKDRIRLVNKRVWINGVPQNEGYVHFLNLPPEVFRDNFPRLDFLSPNIKARWYMELREHVVGGELMVPEGQYFVMGDNRDDSDDSRFWGFVPQENIVGRPLLVYWSLRNSGGERSSVSDKITHSLYVVTHLYQVTRWDRTFRIVR